MFWQNFSRKASDNLNKRLTKSVIIFYGITVLLICAGMTFQLHSLISKYFCYDYDEVTISVAAKPEFPDVTICNMDAIYADR